MVSYMKQIIICSSLFLCFQLLASNLSYMLQIYLVVCTLRCCAMRADAVETLRDYATRHAEFLRDKLAARDLMDGLCRKLVQSCAERQGPAPAMQLVSTLYELGFLKQGAAAVLEALVSTTITRSGHYV